MNISALNNNPNFKATYPVVHWVAESNGSYAPVANLKIVKQLQGSMIRMLNKDIYESNKPMDVIAQRLRAYIGSCDKDYRNIPRVRSFYDRVTGGTNYKPVSYVISGEDVAPFEEMLSKDIGRTKGKLNAISGASTPEEVKQAVDFYNKNGMDFVKNRNIKLKDEYGMFYVLHTKFEIVRNKLGKIKGYRFVDARFLPERGPENPFEKFGMLRK